MKLANRVALVTGAASGIGRATALTLASEGAKVVVSDINLRGGEDTLELIRQMGGEAVFVRSDVAASVEVAALVDKTIETYGQLDCAVNNAGVGGDMLPTDQREEAVWDRVIAVNLKGVWLCMNMSCARCWLKGGEASSMWHQPPG
jgi:NAD(P)-dependent dehydrogenase (short-subunit alcohol dehydrogenase family)